MRAGGARTRICSPPSHTGSSLRSLGMTSATGADARRESTLLFGAARRNEGGVIPAILFHLKVGGRSVKAKEIKKTAKKVAKKVQKAAAPKIKAMQKAAKPYVKKAKRAAEDLAEAAEEKGREILKDALAAGSKKLKKASKAV
ncbi:MAG TPA: hypothetical protein VL284_18185 [Thermoanaerobaculia bacterium]|nr:hypothetical protein [Thermoanaerobaculia bacterium]